MDEIVRQAMAKWPNVPHCTGWLALDARGQWRMRDAGVQARGEPGDPIRNTTLTGFINRNYVVDEAGRWYFQNGPQRVYVDLELTPFICRTDPQAGLLLHTGAPLQPQAAFITEDGLLGFVDEALCAALDDRDLAACLSLLRVNGSEIGDDFGLALEAHDACLTLEWAGQTLQVEPVHRDELAARYRFDPRPRLS